MLELWRALLNLYNGMYERPWDTMKILELEKESAPKEYGSVYDMLIMICKLKIIADRRNMTIGELVDEIVKEYIDRVWGDMYEHRAEKGNQ